MEKKFRKLAIGLLANTKVFLDKLFKEPYPSTKKEALTDFVYRDYTTLQLAGCVSAIALEVILLGALVVSIGFIITTLF